MLVYKESVDFLTEKVGFRKSATESSQLNKKAAKNVERYSGSFSPPGDGDVRAIYDMTTVSEMGINDFQVKNSTPTRGRLNNKPLENRLLIKLGEFRVEDFKQDQALPSPRSRGKLFTPQPTRRDHRSSNMFESPLLRGKRFESPVMGGNQTQSPLARMKRFESSMPGEKKTIINQFQNDQFFSSPKSERGFLLRKNNIYSESPARYVDIKHVSLYIQI